MSVKYYSFTSTFYRSHSWNELSAVMAAHLDWTVERCKRYIQDGNKISDSGI